MNWPPASLTRSSNADPSTCRRRGSNGAGTTTTMSARLTSDDSLPASPDPATTKATRAPEDTPGVGLNRPLGGFVSRGEERVRPAAPSPPVPCCTPSTSARAKRFGRGSGGSGGPVRPPH